MGLDNRRSDGRISPLDQAYNELGLLRKGRAMRELKVDLEFFRHLIGTGKLRAVPFMHNGREQIGYPADRIAEIAERAEAVTPRARW
jgi:hypothetical protein